MIGYVQSRDIGFRDAQIRAWPQGLVETQVDGWTVDDALHITNRDAIAGSALLESVHRRNSLPDIRLHHLWIDMGGDRPAS